MKYDSCHQHKVKGHNLQPAPYHLCRVRTKVVLKWILFFEYTKHFFRQITFKPFCNIIRKAHTFTFFYQYLMSIILPKAFSKPIKIIPVNNPESNLFATLLVYMRAKNLWSEIFGKPD